MAKVRTIKAWDAPDKNIAPLDQKLFYAIKEQNIEKIKLLLDQGANVNAQNSRIKITPLETAIKANNAEIAELLLQHGADTTQLNWCKHTPLLQAVKKDNIKIVELLLEYGADPDFKAHNGQQAIDIATDNKNEEMVELFNSLGGGKSLKAADTLEKAEHNQSELIADLNQDNLDLLGQDNSDGNLDDC